MKTVNNIIEKANEKFLHKEATLAEVDRFMMKLLKNFDGNFELISIEDGATIDHLHKGNYYYADFEVLFDLESYNSEDLMKSIITIYSIEWDTSLI